MMQDCISSNKIKENKYKILRMSLILGSDEDRSETINNFEEAAREIDAMNDEIYLKDLEDKFYDTIKLEEEEQKLAVLVDYIGGRVEQRISLLSDFANITGYDLSNLPPIKYYDKLDNYKERLKYIREYLSNTEQINQLTQDLEDSEAKLKEAYLNKATSEECNARNEEILLNKFMNIIKNQTNMRDITESNIDSKLNDIISAVKESKKSLDIFEKSFTTLSGSGINPEEEQEYKSYVDNAKDVYYTNKEQEYLFRIYQSLIQKESEYSTILEKRETINNLLFERLNLRKDLKVESNDILEPLYDLLDKQYKDIQRQKENMEIIDTLNNIINSKKETRNELEQENQKVEILSLLREFCMIDTYTEVPDESNQETPVEETNVEESNTELPKEDNTESPQIPEIKIPEQLNINKESTPIPNLFESPTQKTEPVIEEPPKDNQVILVEDAKNIDLELIHSKASKVMKRVGEMLGIKTEETKIVSVSNPTPNTEKELSPTETPPAPTTTNKELPPENPLFSNNLTEPQSEAQQDPSDNFWFPSDTPDALNELPDLEVPNNNFFANNSIPNLNFPDLKIDFGPNDTEGDK